MCVLADICNHTWIPECGRELNDSHLRLFIDECDLYEYNCDNEKYYEIQNYSDCFMGPGECPTHPPCPSHPTCPNHRFHRMGQRYFFLSSKSGRRMARPIRTTLKITLPYRMLHGKRRYTPIPRVRRQRMRMEERRQKIKKQQEMKKLAQRRTFVETNVKASIKPVKPKPAMKVISKVVNTKLTKFTRETIVLRRQTFLKNGNMFVKIVKAYVTKPMATQKCTKGSVSDFLEK